MQTTFSHLAHLAARVHLVRQEFLAHQAVPAGQGLLGHLAGLGHLADLALRAGQDHQAGLGLLQAIIALLDAAQIFLHKESTGSNAFKN